jgi:hypothetical protein
VWWYMPIIPALWNLRLHKASQNFKNIKMVTRVEGDYTN